MTSPSLGLVNKHVCWSGLVLAMVIAACGTSAESAAPNQTTESQLEEATTATNPVETDTTTSIENQVAGSSAGEPSEADLEGDPELESATDIESTTTITTSSTTTPPTTANPASLSRVTLQLTELASLERPVAVIAHPSTGDLFIAEQTGRLIRRRQDGALSTIVDLSSSVSGGNEQGLLGLAFSPDMTQLYINLTDRDGDTIVGRYSADSAGIVDEASFEVVLTVDQPRANHNGGHIVFGPDGYLYIGLGDGGGGGDPLDAGQDPSTLLGSILRIDVSGDEGYSIPPDNPFVDGGGAPEVFLFGVRNPWRFSFDPVTGDLWVADVGQDRFEEVTYLPASQGAGLGANLGWNEMEGPAAYRSGVEPADHVPPLTGYTHADGRCSITGGDIYRGDAIPALSGAYVFADFCTGEVWAVDPNRGGELVLVDAPRISDPSGFGRDADGELLVLSRRGSVFAVTNG